MSNTKDLGFAPNYKSALEIDTAPENANPTWAILSRGITNITPSANEQTDDKDYYDGYGVPTTDVKSTQIQYEVEGDRCYGDPAQDYISSCALLTGEGRKTRFRHTAPNGDVIEGDCTLLNLVPGSAQGEASAPGSFGCTIATAGNPKFTPANKLKLPTGLDVTAPTGPAVGAKVQLAPKVTPETANPKCFFASGDTDVVTVDSDGNLTGVAAGKAKVTVRCAANPSLFKQVDVTVTAAAK